MPKWSVALVAGTFVTHKLSCACAWFDCSPFVCCPLTLGKQLADITCDLALGSNVQELAEEVESRLFRQERTRLVRIGNIHK